MFLKSLCQGLKSYKPSIIPSTKKASVAVVLRQKERENQEKSMTQVLFIKRALNENDLWSGQIAFPGGRRKLNESGYNAARRETHEEIGLDLNPKNFACLGRLNDRSPMSSLSMVVSSYVFLQCTEKEDKFLLASSEVSHAFWTDITEFRRCQTQKLSALMPTSITESPCYAHKEFPCVVLNPQFNATMNLHDDATRSLKPDDFVLWGMSLSIIVDILQLAKEKLPPSLCFRGPIENTGKKINDVSKRH